MQPISDLKIALQEACLARTAAESKLKDLGTRAVALDEEREGAQAEHEQATALYKSALGAKAAGESVENLADLKKARDAAAERLDEIAAGAEGLQARFEAARVEM